MLDIIVPLGIIVTIYILLRMRGGEGLTIRFTPDKRSRKDQALFGVILALGTGELVFALLRQGKHIPFTIILPALIAIGLLIIRFSRTDRS